MIAWRKNCLKTTDRILGLLGIARRAGKLALGADAAAEAVNARSARLVLLSRDLSPRTAGDVRARAEKCGVRAAGLRATMDELEAALGKRTGVIAVKDTGFAKTLLALCAQERGGISL
ncbi:MAG TPA: 50S ribosomal protein L7ae [Ruminococcaceae bacterium]|jgi:ribosomal protein L7Ae-like RNA K-turn-binding protein|nr:50S ribosomal protein L7ae [Oscillospiraceae bacterium]HBG55724.1 50S ribosomal protein L7ae [Oscillospiraceae bacterium]HBQ46600.1 50S ribosomal protein L7ae [Oscillospiraceae bacterium]